MQDTFGDLDDNGVMLLPVSVMFKKLFEDGKLALD